MIHSAIITISWVVAVSWLWKVLSAAIGLPRVPNLILPAYDLTPTGNPSLTVIVPACNEAPHITACLNSLLQQDYPNLHIIAVNDRSTDNTGAIIDSIVAQHPTHLPIQITALHITELPPDWLGKTHAMALAARQSPTDYILFTDADVIFRPDALRRSLAYAVASRADHLITVPTTIIHRWDEAAVLGFFQIFSLWAARPWKIPDPRAKHDAIGIGAFNLVRRAAYLQIGGFEAQRMDITEDIIFGRRVKKAGLAQRMAFGRDLVSVHWASGAHGLVNVMTKNIFAAFRFHISLLLAACVWLAAFCFAPLIGLIYAPTRVPAALTLAAVIYGYRLLGRTSGISAWNGLLSPISALIFIYTLLRSMTTTLRQGGVIWRGTFYPLATLRKASTPLF
jgi:glycosyltransferase involved in cell wall biosynthesis